MTTGHSRSLHDPPYFDSTTLVVLCVTTALSYLVPKLAGLLISNPQTVWPLWPGCAILVSGLLLVRVSVWPLLIPASFLGFALADLQAGVPLSSIAWFIPGNTVEVLISAIGLRYCFDGVPRLNSLRALVKYSVFAVVVAPFAGAFLSAHGIAHDYWTGWKIVFLSEMLAFITVTPALLSWVSEGRVLIRRPRAHHLEGVLLIAGLVLVSYIVFTIPADSRSPALFYALVPFLLWSALRFGWFGVSTSLIAVTFLSIWGAVDGRGPFSNTIPLTNPLPLQMFLIFASIPFLVLAALAEEHQRDAYTVRESEERFRLIANTAPVMIWMSGTDKLCTYFNKPWLDFTGRSMEQELGNGWTEGVHPDDLRNCLDTYTASFDRKEKFRMEYRLRRNDGEYRWIFDIGVPRFHQGDRFAGYIGIVMDVTERKQAEEKLREYEKAVEGAEDMIGVIDREYRFLLANRQYLKMRNLTRQQVVGQFIPEVLGREVFETAVKPKLDECLAGKVVRYEGKFSYPGVGERDLLLSYYPIEGANGTIDRAACILRDITDRKRAEEELSGMTRKLVEAQEQERTRIARELHDDINQRLAMLAVELAQLKDHPSEVGIRVQELRKQVIEISSDVEALAHDLHSSKLEYLGVVAGMKSWCREFGERQGMKIDFRQDVRSTLPREIGLCLFRVLQEALQNAAKHSGVKWIEVELTEVSGEIQLMVRDLGKGFDMETAKQGRGLGLTSMQERVRLVNGTIDIESSPTGGTNIRVRIPLAQQSSAARQSA